MVRASQQPTDISKPDQREVDSSLLKRQRADRTELGLYKWATGAKGSDPDGSRKGYPRVEYQC